MRFLLAVVCTLLVGCTPRQLAPHFLGNWAPDFELYQQRFGTLTIEPGRLHLEKQGTVQ